MDRPQEIFQKHPGFQEDPFRQGMPIGQETTAYSGGQVQRPRFKQSGLGIASLILGILVIVFYFISFIIAVYLEATTPGGVADDSPVLMVVGLVMIASMVFNILGLVLAGVGLAQANRAKAMSILGLIINSLSLLGMVGLMVLGLVLGP